MSQPVRDFRSGQAHSLPEPGSPIGLLAEYRPPDGGPTQYDHVEWWNPETLYEDSNDCVSVYAAHNLKEVSNLMFCFFVWVCGFVCARES